MPDTRLIFIQCYYKIAILLGIIQWFSFDVTTRAPNAFIYLHHLPGVMKIGHTNLDSTKFSMTWVLENKKVLRVQKSVSIIV